MSCDKMEEVKICDQFIEKNLNDISKLQIFKVIEFNYLKLLMKSNNLVVPDEKRIFEIAIEWLNVDIQTRQQFGQQLMENQSIRIMESAQYSIKKQFRIGQNILTSVDITPRRYGNVFANEEELNERLLCIGGEASPGNRLNSIEMCADLGSIWNKYDNIIPGRSSFVSCKYENYIILIGGGGATYSCTKYDPKNKTFIELEPLPDFIADHVATIINSQLFICGGGHNPKFLISLNLIERNGKWRNRKSSLENRRDLLDVRLIYVTRVILSEQLLDWLILSESNTPSRTSNKNDNFEPENHTSEKEGVCRCLRTEPEGQYLKKPPGGRQVKLDRAIPGNSCVGPPKEEPRINFMSSEDFNQIACEYYCPQEDTWRPLLKMKEERYNAGSCYDNNKFIYVVGGSDWGKYLSLTSMERFDVEIGQWLTLKSSIGVGRRGLTLTIFKNQIILIGGTDKNRKCHNTIQKYDSISDSKKFRENPNLNKFEISGFKLENVNKIFDFFYSDSIIINNNDLKEIVRLAKIFQLDRVLGNVFNYVKGNLNFENVLSIRDLWMSCDKMEEVKICDQFIEKNLNDISKLQIFKVIEFNYLKLLMKSNNLVVPDEKRIFEIAIEWLSVDIQTRQQFGQQLMEDVRFPLMSYEFLLQIPDHELIQKKSLRRIMESVHYSDKKEFRIGQNVLIG
ncbi:Ring canal kelch protein [Nymphon striatum]|nr:Ring canal kelch protein [Nymphon striatum]